MAESASYTSAMVLQRHPSVRYAIAPRFDGVRLKAVAVTVQLNANATGQTRISLPNTYGGTKELYRLLSAVEVRGGTKTIINASEVVIRSRPRTPLTIGYLVHSGYDHEPTALDRNLYAGAVIRPTWFEALGEMIFIAPDDRGSKSAQLQWLGWPKEWKHLSSEDGRRSTVDDIIGSSLLAGTSVKLRRREIAGGSLRLASRGTYPWSLDAYADRLAAVISAQRTFWGDGNGDYSVSLIKLERSAKSSSVDGTGRNNGFVQYASPDGPPEIVFRTVAHEHNHNWIPRQLGTLSSDEDAAANYWFTEGFTEFYTARTLIRSGQWAAAEFVGDLNETLKRLAKPTVQDVPDTRVAKEFFTDDDIGQLAYDRGHIFAILLDYTLRQHGLSLDHVMFAMHRSWLAAPADRKPLLMTNLFNTFDGTDVNARAMIDKYVERGELIELPMDALASCATVELAKIAEYDPGYDRQQTLKTEVFSGVLKDGPAYAAGLRDGMKRVAFVSGVPGDSQVELKMRVNDDGTEKIIG